MNQSPSINELLKFYVNYARRYLASGGPTSRLEESLGQVGHKFGYESEVFATPTGVFFTCQKPGENPTTSLARIKESSINLGELCKLERSLDDILCGKISVRTANAVIIEGHTSKSAYPGWHFAFAAFVAGFAVSFEAYQSMQAAWISGVITFVTWLLTGAYFRGLFPSSMLRDFLGAFVALGLACVANYNLPISIEAYSVGALVLLVPGLLLTTAIAELAEQNLVSGTAKLMQALLVLLAIGLAYILIHEISHSFDLGGVLESSKQKPRIFGVSLLTVVTSIYCYGVIFRVPPPSLIWSSLTGLSAWLVLKGVQSTLLVAAAPYFASVAVGVLSLGLGRLFRVPSQTYSVPGIMAMLPGMLALSSFRYFALGFEETGIALSFKVVLTASSIVLGLLTARVPFVLWRTFREGKK
jgi:uncharacterized membrane protein YjjP (DUF1212 family)